MQCCVSASDILPAHTMVSPPKAKLLAHESGRRPDVDNKPSDLLDLLENSEAALAAQGAVVFEEGHGQDRQRSYVAIAAATGHDGSVDGRPGWLIGHLWTARDPSGSDHSGGFHR
jgi:hypothetical protein